MSKCLAWSLTSADRQTIWVDVNQHDGHATAIVSLLRVIARPQLDMGQHSGATELLNTSAAIACIVVWSLTMDEPYGHGWRDVPKQDLPTLTDATLTN